MATMTKLIQSGSLLNNVLATNKCDLRVEK